MMGFEVWISGLRSDRFTTATIIYIIMIDEKIRRHRDFGSETYCIFLA